MPNAGLTCTAAFLMLAAAANPAKCAAPPFPLGAYLGDPSNSAGAAETQFELTYNSFTSALGVRPTLITTYIDFTQPISNWVGNAGWEAVSHAFSADGRSLEPVIGLPMFSTDWGSPTPDAQYQSFISGQYDSVITGIVQVWAQSGFKNLIFRTAWEMNIPGNTYVGSDAQSRADWITAYRHIYTVLHQAASTFGVSVQVVWNPNATNYDTNDTRALYPGDAFVDVIGVDAYADMYPYSDGYGGYHDWHTGQEDNITQFMADPVNRRHYWTWPAATQYSNDGSGGHNLSLSVLMGFARNHHKPFAIPESGAGNCNNGHDVCDDPTFPIWLANRLHAEQARGLTVSFVNIWDAGGQGNYEFSFTGDGKPLESAAWGRAFGER